MRGATEGQRDIWVWYFHRWPKCLESTNLSPRQPERERLKATKNDGAWRWMKGDDPFLNKFCITISKGNTYIYIYETPPNTDNNWCSILLDFIGFNWIWPFNVAVILMWISMTEIFRSNYPLSLKRKCTKTECNAALDRSACRGTAYSKAHLMCQITSFTIWVCQI